MNFENMENIKKDQPKEVELELEMHAGPIKEEKRPTTPEEIHKHKMNFINESPDINLESEKPKSVKEQIKEAAQAIPPSIQAMAEEKVKEIENKNNSFVAQSNINNIEKKESEADLVNRMLTFEEKIKYIEQFIADKKGDEKAMIDAQNDLINTKKEYEKLFQEYSEKIKKESLNK
jgi:hypothetical protein